MILVREVIEIDPSRMREAKAAAKEMSAIETELGLPPPQAFTDLIGEFYTLVIHIEYDSMGAFEKSLPALFSNEKWQAAYAKMKPLIKGGRREIYQKVE